MSITLTALIETSDGSYKVKKKNFFPSFFSFEENLDIQQADIFPNIPCIRVLTNILLYAKASYVRSMRLFGNPFCFGMSGNVSFEHISTK